MNNITFRALPIWPHGKTADRRSRWAFKASWGDTLSLLEYELERTGASNCIIAAGFREHEIRQDGMPRGNARQPEHPGVEISFDQPPETNTTTTRGRALIRQHGSVKNALKVTHPDVGGRVEDYLAIQAATQTQRVVLATDAYELWQHNVRAIALSLKALRDMERYGATQGRQYAGFRQLTAGRAA